jgi:ribosomal protein L37E
MDLSKLDLSKLADDGTVMPLLHPIEGEVLTDKEEVFDVEVKKIKESKLSDAKVKAAIEALPEPKDFYFKLLGSDSDIYRNALKRQLEKASGSKKGKSNKIDLDDAVLKLSERCARCVTECYFIENGEVVKCGFEEMVRVFIKYSWIREQVDAHISDRSTLMKG